jgi:hypothetical protein
MATPITTTSDNATLSVGGAVKFKPSPPNGPSVQVRLPNNLSYTVQINSVFDVAAAQTIESYTHR